VNDGLSNAALVALMAIVPLVILMLTSFVKLSVVLSLLRNAIGSSDAPSGLVVLGLSLVLTLFVMAPVGIDMVRAAASAPTAPAPGQRGPAPAPSPSASPSPSPSPATSPPSPGDAPLDAVRQIVPEKYQGDVDAVARALVPLEGFLAKHADAKDRDTFVALAQRMGKPAKGDELWVLAPAFLTTELREAFAIAVLVFVPFLVIDLLVGLGLAALGLSTTKPETVALPLKLLLFVAVDGWRLLIDSLLRGYV
jgi:type III secretion protein R